MNKEQVIQGLTCCIEGYERDCSICPYDEYDYCTMLLMMDALDLIKEGNERLMR